MLRTRRGAGLVVAGLLLAGACGDDDESNASGGATTSTSTTVAPVATTASTAAPSSTTATTAESKLSPSGFRGLTVGMTLAKAKADGLVTNVRAGCEPAGENQQGADVPGAPDAHVTFDFGKLSTITLRQGETAEGLRVGATIDQAKQTYSGNGFKVTIDDSTVEVFGIITVKVTRNGADAYEFAADAESKRIDSLSYPELNLCD